ncbi:hypothetical protein J2X68_008022 [Streptomyces sp. 3330]|nr:hypothetical protein [Streptomyces sp. 3330]
MVFAARLASVDRRRTGVGTPFFARTWEPSTQARDQSSWPAAFSSASRMRCSWSKTPARCHRSRRRQQVCPEPNPPTVGVARLCRCRGRRGCPGDRPDPPPAADLVTARARTATTDRSAPTSRRPRSTAEYSQHHKRPNRQTGHAQPAHLNKIVLRALGAVSRIMCGAR